MLRALDLAGSFAASLVRGGAGAHADAVGTRPTQRLELYEFEACPFCRKAREAVTALDLEVLVLPCPKGGTRFRPKARELGGRAQFPYLVDPGRGEALYESDDIVAYLHEHYGAPGSTPGASPLRDVSAMLAGAPRLAKGGFARASRAPDEALELYAFEASPFCRIVREALCELELPYVLHSSGKGSARRAELEARAGRVQLPYLVDPNEGIELFESADIVAYLNDRYALG